MSLNLFLLDVCYEHAAKSLAPVQISVDKARIVKVNRYGLHLFQKPFSKKLYISDYFFYDF